MPIITSIKSQKNKNRVNIYLDNKFGFGIDLDNFVLLKLKIGQELTDNEITKIIKKSEFQKILEKLYKFATLRPRSVKEITDYLSRKKVSKVIWSDLFSPLKNYHLVDDTAFARWWVDQRQTYSPKSLRVLIQELRLKGISKEIIQDTLQDSQIDEKDIALSHLQKRRLHWQALPEEKRPQKMLEYLIRQGFTFEVAGKAVKAYNMTEDDKVN